MIPLSSAPSSSSPPLSLPCPPPVPLPFNGLPFHPFSSKTHLDGSTPPLPLFATPPHCAPSLAHLPSATLTSLSFSLLTSHSTLRLSHLPVINRTYYETASLEPQRFGVLDRHLGVSTKTSRCQSCGKGLADCIGHFGHVQLTVPVFHLGFFKETVKVLQQICKTCSRVLLSANQAARYRAWMRAASDPQRKSEIHAKHIIPATKKHHTCPHCFAANGIVKKLSTAFRIVHELRFKEGLKAKEDFVASFDEATAFNPSLNEFVQKTPFDLNPLWVLYLFQRIPSADCILLNFEPAIGRPEAMILTTIIVPPACLRPSVFSMGVGSSNEDDLTVKLGDIIFINNVLATSIEKGASISNIVENWDFLQQQCAMYINADLPGFPKSVGTHSKPIRALIQRLKGKQGRFRGNLSGKRVDFSSRTVISPDPNLRIDEVGVPEYVAKTLTYPERVHQHNLECLRLAVLNGPDVWPGANTVELVNGIKIALRYGNRPEIARKLCFGDTVERHLIDGDVVLFNRQPSLHRLSIMAHRVRVLQWRTFRFNECVCAPYNADFDGDEMNLHVPQTEEARCEAFMLMGVKENMVTPRHGEPLITATQDFITSSYLLTQKDVFYDRAHASQICVSFSDAREYIQMPLPAIMKPRRLWTGKQIMSLLLKPNEDSQWACVNVEVKDRHYTRAGCMCERDGYVIIRNSELMCGSWAKTTVGGDKSGLLYSMIRDHSPEHAANMLNRLAKLSARWIGERGFSIGIDDVSPSKALIQHKQRMLSAGYALCAKQISLYQLGRLSPSPGCNEEQTLEATLLGELSQMREDLGSFCLRELNSLYNSPLIMAVCGSKGSKINISQMISAVGQQAVSGQRIPEGFVNRTLPHFPKHDRSPAAKGFVENSFFSGLTATEFFFHTMGGREGLVDTAVKTAETGYMQRRLMKALEDLCVAYDDTVRTSERNIVQFVYGDDGLDPLMMTQGHQPVQFGRLLDQCRALLCHDQTNSLLPSELSWACLNILEQPRWTARCTEQFIRKLHDFVDGIIKDTQIALDTLQLKEDTSRDEEVYAAAWRVFDQTKRITRAQLTRFFDECYDKYLRANIEPGTAVGAIGAQSIGEPGTQMTLKTFHFAGVASMNITLGVPRIKEVINAAKKISTPIITAPLVSDRDLKAARIVKARIERTTLGEICRWMEEVITPTECYLEIELDLKAIDALQLATDADSITRAILSHKKLKFKGQVEACGPHTIRVSFGTESNGAQLRYQLTRLQSLLPSVLVCGVSNVNRAVINDVGVQCYNLLVEGYNLLGVMTTVGVKGTECTSNHIDEMQRVLGIEAARATIIREIQSTMEGHGLTIDFRHTSLLADIMCYRGRVLGITRFGVAQMKESVLMLASFEKTADHLFEAAMRGTRDSIQGVSECIIMGTKMPVGTGLFTLMLKAQCLLSNAKNGRQLLLR